ncbi:MAG: MarR family transcriptional regulator [Lachnospiraceae bacterium]|nr:MarR family transcriptional regulator [Lachnospiraceae bacterium]
MDNRFEHFTLNIFTISRYWNKIATDEMKKYGLRGTHALYLLLLDRYEGEITAAKLADLCQRDKADVSRALADFQKKEILEPYNGSRYRITPKLTPLGRTIAAQIRERAAVALDLASQGITDEMRENMYYCLDLISANMREICEDGLMDQ